MAKWPGNKGPLGGNCPECGGLLILEYSDRVYKAWVCQRCGLYHDNRGISRRIPPQQIGQLINEVFKEIDREEVDIWVFLKVLDARAKELNLPSISYVSRQELNQWGFDLYGVKLRRKK